MAGPGQPTRAQARVQRCGKSAPAASRGAGSVNPGWEQGPGTMVGHDTRPDSSAPLEAAGDGGPRQMIAPSRCPRQRHGEQNPAYALLSRLFTRIRPPDRRLPPQDGRRFQEIPPSRGQARCSEIASRRGRDSDKISGKALCAKGSERRPATPWASCQRMLT